MNQIVEIKKQIGNMGGEFAKALPGHISPEKFIRTAQTAVSLTRNIEKVRDMQSLLAACSKAAADGLILDGREAALVIDYQGRADYRPMMRGLLKLAHNSGEIKSLVVETVRENDVFDYAPTRADEPIFHTIDLKADRGETYAVYALAVMKSGGIVFEVMTVEDVNRIRDRSDAWRAYKAGKIKSTPWATDWSEMARKTVFRRLSKYLPSSTDRDDRLQSAAEQIDGDYTFIDDEPIDARPAPAGKKKGAGAAALKDITPKKPKQDDAPPADETPPHDAQTGEIMEGEIIEPQPGDDI